MMEKTTSASAAQVLKNVVQECFVTKRSGAEIVHERHDAKAQSTRVWLRTATRHEYITACMTWSIWQEQLRACLPVMQQRKRSKCTNPMWNDARPSVQNARTIIITRVLTRMVMDTRQRTIPCSQPDTKTEERAVHTHFSQFQSVI